MCPFPEAATDPLPLERSQPAAPSASIGLLRDAVHPLAQGISRTYFSSPERLSSKLT